MATTYTATYVYDLNYNGQSNNGKLVSVDGPLTGSNTTTLAPTNTGATSVGVGDKFTISDSPTYSGTWTVDGHYGKEGILATNDSTGHEFLFSGVGNLPLNQNISNFDTTTTAFTLCFLAGTMISCPGEERAIETLAMGDLVLTADGRAVPVKWLARETIARLFGIPEGRRPVMIEPGALGDNVPTRALRLTSDHALLIDGVLVHAGALVNGCTIRHLSNEELGPRFVVYHIETEDHEVILAEGTPSETFIDNAMRRLYDNYQEYESLYGNQERPMEELPYPRAMSSRQLPASIRSQVAQRAASYAQLA